ncbi:MAG: glycosyltransferase family 2 protein [Lachnospiraceae bacterium]|nr:glycosyltransferase family 2 protein [Lachnospiraceae bacterium]
MKKKISIGIPCYNEEENIELMYKAICNQIEKMPQYDYEIIFSDNDSQDESQKIMRSIANNDKRVKIIINQTNFGPYRSGVNCYNNASGDAYIVIPCDFQEPPEMIPDYIREWENGYDIVWGQKTESNENKIKYACRKVFYGIINKMSDYPQLNQVIGYGLMDRKVVDILLVTQRQDPQFEARNLVCEYGFKIKLLPYTQAERKRGKSSYSVGKYYDFAITSLVNTSVKPLRMMTIIGLLVSFLCFISAIFYFVYKMVYWDSFTVGMAPLIIGLFFVAGIQLFCLGMLGEYIAVLIRRVTNKPLVVEKEKINF